MRHRKKGAEKQLQIVCNHERVSMPAPHIYVEKRDKERSRLTRRKVEREAMREFA